MEIDAEEILRQLAQEHEGSATLEASIPLGLAEAFTNACSEHRLPENRMIEILIRKFLNSLNGQ